MKKLVTLLIVFAFTVITFSQPPEKMSYQAIVRNASGVLVVNQSVGMRISILQDSETGTAVYVETQTTTTNANGLVTIEIGNGTPALGTFAGIDWSTGVYFIKTETDPAGGTAYTIIGTSQILSVPYALYAKSAGNGTLWSKTGSNIYFNNGNVGIGTTSPVNKLHVQNGNMVIDRPLSTTILSLGTVAGVTGRIFAGDNGGGSLNTNYNQIKITANPANTEELLRLHTGADAMSNAGIAAIYFGQFNLTDMAAIKAVNEGGQPLNRTAGLSFWTEPAGTGVPLQERMRISGNGNIGIGTTTPSARLEINGQLKITGGTPASGEVLTTDGAGLASWEPIPAAAVNQIYFEVKRSASYDWPVMGSVQKIDFSTNSTVWENQGNAFNTLTSTFTAPEDGIYSFKGAIQFINITSGSLIYTYLKAGDKNYNGNWKNANSESEMVDISLTIFLSQGQTAELWGYVNDPTPPATVNGNATDTFAFTYFTGAKVR